MASVKRSLSINENLDEKLTELCNSLGVSPNNYITNAVAKAVLNDSTALVAQKSANDGVAKMVEIFKRIDLENEMMDR